MRVHVADHPLITHKLTYLRDKRTDSPTFRRLAEELVTLLAYEATRDVRVEPFEIETPVAPTTGIKLSNPKPLIVPILRAGLGMLEGMVRLLPSAEVGFLGMQRNEETLEAITYANRLPDDLTGRQCYVLDPMLATGGTLADVDPLPRRARRRRHHRRDACSPPPRASSTSRRRCRPRHPHHDRHRRGRRAAQREGLHRARPRVTPVTASTAWSDQLSRRAARLGPARGAPVPPEMPVAARWVVEVCRPGLHRPPTKETRCNA